MAAIKVISTLTISGPLNELREQIEAATGTEIDLELAPTVLIMERLAAGATPDVVALTKEKIDEMVADGRAVAGSNVDLVVSQVGVGVGPGVAKPSIDTVDAVKAALLGAKSICYSKAGASGIFFAGLIERLGIADAVKAKATIIPEGLTGELAARGDVEMSIQQVSELMAVPGVEILGPLPEEIGQRAEFSAALLASSKEQEAGRRVIEYLASEELAAVYRRYGLTPSREA